MLKVVRSARLIHKWIVKPIKIRIKVVFNRAFGHRFGCVSLSNAIAFNSLIYLVWIVELTLILSLFIQNRHSFHGLNAYRTKKGFYFNLMDFPILTAKLKTIKLYEGI